MKKALFYTFLIQFFIVFVITILGLIQMVHIKEGYLDKLFYFFIVELIAAVISIFKKADFFPEDKHENSSKENITLIASDFQKFNELKTHQKQIPNNEEPIALTEEDYFSTCQKLHDRFLEQEEFKNKVSGKNVKWKGLIHSISTEKDYIHIYLKIDTNSLNGFSAILPIEEKIKAFSYRKNDLVEIQGTLATSSTMPRISNATIDRILNTPITKAS
ncbi:MAG: hypothetical protein V4507_01135 [Verrucomicrobiota bacterium]